MERRGGEGRTGGRKRFRSATIPVSPEFGWEPKEHFGSDALLCQKFDVGYEGGIGVERFFDLRRGHAVRHCEGEKLNNLGRPATKYARPEDVVTRDDLPVENLKRAFKTAYRAEPCQK